MRYDFELDGPRPVVRPRPERRPWQISVWGFMKWTFGLSCLVGLLTLMGRAVGDAREAARRRALSR